MRHLARSQTSPATGSPTNGASIPPLCFANCNKAFLEASRVGLIPELCAVNGAFQNHFRRCSACLQELGLDVEATLATYLREGVYESIFGYCDTVPSQSFASTTRMVTTITALGLNDITTVATMTVVVDLLATQVDSSSLAPSSQTTPAAGPVTDSATGENEARTSESSQAWIAGPVIGAVVVLVALVGAYIFCKRRRKRSQSETPEETWTGKPELHAESVPGLAKSLVEAGTLPRSPPQELEGSPFEPYRHEIPRRAEMAANEVAAGEMAAKTQSQEMDGQTQTRGDENRR